jgi:hypothetical protein
LPLQSQIFSYEKLPRNLKNFISVHHWIKNELPTEGIILSRKPTVTYLYTAHQSVPYPFSYEPIVIWGTITKNKVRYMIVDEFSEKTYRHLMPFFELYGDRLELIYKIDNTGLFEVRKY